LISAYRKYFLLAPILLLILGVIFVISIQKPKLSELTIGFPGPWGSLLPPLQYTMIGDAVLGNQFEPLVDMERGGVIVPFAAKSWQISDDRRVFVFKIDSERRFSDGTKLTAQDFKRSWEDGLKLEAIAAQKSLMDVLYKIEGFEEFSVTGNLKGIEALDEATLKITFNSPFRMALDHLAGSRYAAYKIVNSQYIGTGPYRIVNASESFIQMEKNPYSKIPVGIEKVNIKRLDRMSAENQILNGEIDVYPGAGRTLYQGPCGEGKFGCLDGFEAAHSVLLVNGNSNRVLANPELRLALQFIISRDYNGVSPNLIYDKYKVLPGSRDPQTFLPFQAGRLNDEEAESIIVKGEAFVADLVTASKAHPLVLAYVKGSQQGQAIQELLSAHHITTTEPLVCKSFLELQPLIDHESKPDLAILSASVADGDPDGIYHALGAKGAITTPMTIRQRVSEILESGREIQDISKLDEHYKNAAVAILEEVPWVHLGFLREKTVYRTDKIVVKQQNVKSRIREPFSIFEPK